ncbi:apoptosis regulatory protein Siva-like [Argonauta hians]
MGKRNCPFFEPPVQRKIHVGVKQVDNGVSGNIVSVYEKTRMLLFAGAQRSNQEKDSNMVKSAAACENDLPNGVEEETCQPKILIGQCQIDMSGKLIPYKEANWNHKPS